MFESAQDEETVEDSAKQQERYNSKENDRVLWKG